KPSRRDACVPIPRELTLPIRPFDNLVDTLPQTHAADPQIVGGHRIRRYQMLATHLSGIEIQLLGDFVEVNFQRIAWLRGSMSALGTAWRFVREYAQSFEFVTRHFVSNRL